jgi:hypothetical protein
MKHQFHHRSRNAIEGIWRSELAFIQAVCFCFFSCFGYEGGLTTNAEVVIA